jgi:hypothetical protein
MIGLFLPYVLAAFIVGGFWVGSATFAAERFHSGVGGLIGGLPGTSLVSFFFIGLNQSANIAAQATTVFPLGMSFTFLFLLSYAVLTRYGFKTAISSSLALWFLLSGLEANLQLRHFHGSIIAVISVFSATFLIFRAKLKLPYVIGTKQKFSALTFLEHAIVGGVVVATAVSLSQILSPAVGGTFAAFPGVFSLTLTFTYGSEGGMNLSRSMTKPLMISAFSVALPCSILIGQFYPYWGLYLGTIAALVGVIPLTLLAYFLIHVRRI